MKKYILFKVRVYITVTGEEKSYTNGDPQVLAYHLTHCIKFAPTNLEKNVRSL